MCIALCDSVSHIKISVQANKKCICIASAQNTHLLIRACQKNTFQTLAFTGGPFFATKALSPPGQDSLRFPIAQPYLTIPGIPGVYRVQKNGTFAGPTCHQPGTIASPCGRTKSLASSKAFAASRRENGAASLESRMKFTSKGDKDLELFGVFLFVGWVGGNSTFPKRRSLLEGRAKKLPESLTRSRCREKWRITNPTSNVHLPLQSLPTPLPSSSEMLECKLRLRHSTATQRSGKRALHGHMASPSFPRLQGVVGKQLLANACLMLKFCRF